MPRKNPRVEKADEKDLEVGKPKEWAAGMPGVYHSMQPALKHMGVGRTGKTLLGLNQKDGFDCMSCAWPDPGAPQDVRVLRTGCQGRDVGGHAGGHCLRVLGGAPGQRTAATARILARNAGPPDGAGLQAGRGGLLPAGELGRGLRDRWRQAKGPFQPGPGRVLHQRPDVQRGRVPVPAVRAGLRDQQPAGLLQHVPRVLRLGHGPDHRHRQGHHLLRRLRQGAADHHHGPEPGQQPPAHAHRPGGSQEGRL